MSTLEIKGGTPLCGSVQAVGNKNAVLPMIAAALLTHEPVVLENVPDIDDVHTMLAIAAEFGMSVEWDADRRWLRLCAAELHHAEIPPELCRKIRASVLVVGPLLHRLRTPGYAFLRAGKTRCHGRDKRSLYLYR